MTDWRWGLLGAFVALSALLIWRKQRRERQEIIEFDGDNLDYFKTVQPDWRCERIAKRATALGWETLSYDSTDRAQSSLILKRADQNSATLQTLLLKLQRADLIRRPIRSQLQSTEILK